MSSNRPASGARLARPRWAIASAALILALGAGACVGLLGLEEFTDETGASDAGPDAAACATWARRLELPEVDGGALNGNALLADGQLVSFVATADGTVSININDACDGDTIREGAVHLEGVPGVGSGAPLPDGGGWVIGGALTPFGSDQVSSGGLLAFVREAPGGGFELLDAAVRPMTPGADEVWSVDVAPTGAVLALGIHDFSRWFWLLGPGEQSCDVAGDLRSRGRVVRVTPEGVIFAFFDQPAVLTEPPVSGVLVEKYLDQDFSADGCASEPRASGTLRLGGGWTSVFSVVISEDQAFVAGAVHHSDGGDVTEAQAFLARLDLNRLQADPSWVEQRGTLLGDAFNHVATDGAHAFVVLLAGWVTPGSPNAFRVLRYPLDLESDGAADAVVEIAAWDAGVLREAEALAVDPTPGRGLYLLLLTANGTDDAGARSDAVLMRCDKELGCPNLPEP